MEVRSIPFLKLDGKREEMDAPRDRSLEQDCRVLRHGSQLIPERPIPGTGLQSVETWLTTHPYYSGSPFCGLRLNFANGSSYGLYYGCSATDARYIGSPSVYQANPLSRIVGVIGEFWTSGKIGFYTTASPSLIAFPTTSTTSAPSTQSPVTSSPTSQPLINNVKFVKGDYSITINGLNFGNSSSNFTVFLNQSALICLNGTVSFNQTQFRCIVATLLYRDFYYDVVVESDGRRSIPFTFAIELSNYVRVGPGNVDAPINSKDAIVPNKDPNWRVTGLCTYAGEVIDQVRLVFVHNNGSKIYSFPKAGWQEGGDGCTERPIPGTGLQSVETWLTTHPYYSGSPFCGLRLNFANGSSYGLYYGCSATDARYIGSPSVYQANPSSRIVGVIGEFWTSGKIGFYTTASPSSIPFPETTRAPSTQFPTTMPLATTQMPSTQVLTTTLTPTTTQLPTSAALTSSPPTTFSPTTFIPIQVSCENCHFGYCIDERGCSCESGRSGPQCALSNQEHNPSLIHSTKLNSTFIFNFIPSKTLLVEIKLPSVVGCTSGVDKNGNCGTFTLIHFHGGSSHCNYPRHTGWRLSSTPDGFDVYLNELSYAQLVDCGLKDSGSNNTDHKFDHSLSVKRGYLLSSGEFSLGRNSSSHFNYSVLFPRKKSVSTVVNMVDNTLVHFAANTDSFYDVPNDKWIINFSSLTKAPYFLNDSHLISLTTSSNGNDLARTKTLLHPSECSSPLTPTDKCLQTFGLEVKGCEEFRLNVTVRFTIACRSDYPYANFGSCIDSATPFVTSSFEMLFSSSCPAEKSATIDGLSMATFKDSNLTTPEQNFGQNHLVYFAVAFSSPATIKSVSIDAVCISESQLTELPCLSSKQLQFSYNFPIKTSQFSKPVQATFSVEGQSFAQLVTLSSTKFTAINVQVDLTITYEGGFQKKRSITISSAQTKIALIGETNINKLNLGNNSLLLIPSQTILVIIVLFLLS
eukprot:TRINITY_DN2807_c0_g1_i3.p1 TRINITY_DN2807_c0_g1~~TRINITY_DN2807_c0_g1_i3.p1  ORF type:complete len:973 (-),score=134.38 TRINITY_DN2807_c0_g1_i3:47-2965(-)